MEDKKIQEHLEARKKEKDKLFKMMIEKESKDSVLKQF